MPAAAFVFAAEGKFIARLRRVDNLRRNICRGAELISPERIVGTAQDIPITAARTINGDVADAVAVIIAGDRHIARRAEANSAQSAVRAAVDIPDAV